MASIKAAAARATLGGSGRSNRDDFTSASYNASDISSGVSSVAFRSVRSPLSTSKRSTSLSARSHHAGPASSPSQRDAVRLKHWNDDRDVNAYTSMTSTAAPRRVESKHAKLHKRGGSGSSLPGSPSPLSNAHSQFTTPFATYEEGHQDLDMSSTPPPPSSSTPRIIPYLRKISGGREDDGDQGRLDLSKSTSENSALAGLGIQEYSRSASEVTLPHARRGATGHARNTSGGSQMSTGSGSLRPNQPFVHPMRQTPRPYTPPTGASYASSINDSEAQESDDVLLHDAYQGFRARRSASISSSTPQIQPTPLSQSYTASDLGYIPKLTTTHSETNLSIKSGQSGKSSKSRKVGRSRRNTDRSESNVVATSPSSRRTSFDRAFSFATARRADTEPQSRDERIRAARKKFEEKEAHKDRKWEREELKRRETEEARSVKKMERQQRRSSQQEDRVQGKSVRSFSRDARVSGEKESSEFRARRYDVVRPAHEAPLSKRGLEGGASEKRDQAPPSADTQSGGWLRFSTWLQTRMLSCGGKT